MSEENTSTIRGAHAGHGWSLKVKGHVGVLLMNTGTPDEPTPEAVKAYLGEFLMDPRIVPMNKVMWWLLLHLCILRTRSKNSAEKYKAIWTEEGSSFLRHHERLTQSLNDYYHQQGLPVDVAYAMNYGNPSALAGLEELRSKGCDRLVVLPLYPQGAYSTVEASADAVGRALAKMEWTVPTKVIKSYHDDPVYIKAIASIIRDAGFDASRGDQLLLSYHSIPLADIEAGDTYELQVGSTSLAVASELGLERSQWTISYQSRFDKGRTWLSPFTRKTLRHWAEAQLDSRIFMVCPNFSVDCLETLYDIEFEIKPEYLTAKYGTCGICRAHGASNSSGMQTAAAGAPGQRLSGEGPALSESSTTSANLRESRKIGRESNRDLDDGHYDGSTRDIVIDKQFLGASEEFIYVPCLNSSQSHVEVLLHVLEPYLRSA